MKNQVINTNNFYEKSPALYIETCEKYRVYTYEIIDTNTWLITPNPEYTNYTNEIIGNLKNFHPELKRIIRQF